MKNRYGPPKAGRVGLHKPCRGAKVKGEALAMAADLPHPGQRRALVSRERVKEWAR